jgi:putative hemolysin
MLCSRRGGWSPPPPGVIILAELTIVLALIVANGFFSGSEIALVTLRNTRLQELIEGGNRSAKAALALRQRPERLLATVQIGITVVSATAAAFSGASIATRIEPGLRTLPWLAPYAEEVALGAVVAAVSYLSIVIGELVPKSIAMRSSERVGLLVAQPLRLLAWLAQPLVWLLTASSNLVLKPFGDQTTFTETLYSTDELQQLVEDATRSGSLHPQAAEIASRALDLPQLTAFDVMVPRTEVVMLALDASMANVQTVLHDHPHTRFPVYDGARDNVVGYVNIKDVARRTWETGTFSLRDVLRPAYFAPDSKSALDLLRELQKRRLRLAIVVDERGGMDGIVTVEDMVEELVGELFSEHTRESSVTIVRDPDGSAVVAGVTPLRDVNRALDLDLPEEGDWNTLAGLCIAKAGRIPITGETVQLTEQVTAEIVEASARRVRSVKLSRAVQS